MAKIQLDIPDELHLELKKEQLKLEGEGKKVNLKDLYYDIIRLGLEAKRLELAKK